MPTVLSSINSNLHKAFQLDERVVLLGEDILDPYGGAFKLTSGLSTAYPERVHTTPISEAGIVGIAAGMALRGLRPVVEIMFGDFVTLIADQLINHVSKFRRMYNDQVRVPLVIRTPMGGRRGYGPTHSQSLEKIYLGIPGLRVLAPSAFDDKNANLGGNAGELLLNAVMIDEDPVLFIEHKLLYALELQDNTNQPEYSIKAFSNPDFSYAATFVVNVRGAPPPEITIAAYGYMAEIAKHAIKSLAYEYEIFAELVVPTQLSPIDTLKIGESVAKTSRLITVEEGTLTLGWGAEVIARLSESSDVTLSASKRIAAEEVPIPSSGPLEEAVLPNAKDIITAARGILNK